MQTKDKRRPPNCKARTVQFTDLPRVKWSATNRHQQPPTLLLCWTASAAAHALMRARRWGWGTEFEMWVVNLSFFSLFPT